MDEPGGSGKPRRAHRAVLPVDEMAAEDRDLVTRSARRAYQIIELILERIWDKTAESDGIPKIDRDISQTLVNIQRTAAGMLDKHPGLLADVKAGGVDPEATDDDLDRILGSIEKPGGRDDED